jgi:subtilase family serine protease
MTKDCARSCGQRALRRAVVMTALAGAAMLAGCSGSPRSAPGTGTGEPAAQRITVLTRALRVMLQDYGKLREEPGPVDVLDYQVGDLWKRGIDGTGTTVAVIEGWDSPVLASFMANRDRLLGLPNPQIKTIYPTGRHRLPATCPAGMAKLTGYGSCSSWEGEAALDAFAVHLMAPYAKILVVVAPPDSEITDDAASNVAPPEFMQAVEYVSVHHLANVISISDGTGESTYSHGFEEVRAQDAGELTAAANGIPLLVATGDSGAAGRLPVGSSTGPTPPGGSRPGRPHPRPIQDLITATQSTAAWDDSPWVTAVGGSVPNLSAAGKRLGPDPVWNMFPAGDPDAEGAGFSAVFARPSYQDSVAATTRSKRRSVPDITMDASGGTSEAAPLLAGALALATQLNQGQNVGPINNVLYHVLGPAGLKDGIADVVSGDNTVTIHGKVYVPGFTAARGFDVASGWGTIRASNFVPALARATQAARQDASVRAEAKTKLVRLEHQEQLSRYSLGPGTTTLLTAQGFLPGHPVSLYIDGRKIMGLHAGSRGSVSYLIKPSVLGLRPGRHVVDLVSMLITTTNAFRSA